MTIIGYTPSEIRKTIIAILGFTATVTTALLGANLIPQPWIPWITVTLSILSVYGIFATPNTPKKQQWDEPIDQNLR